MRNTELRQEKRHCAVLLAGASAAILVFAASQTARAAMTPGVPEKQSLEISKILRPIPDEQWQSIAGERVSEKYRIVNGDTLYDISRRLFGDARYWPKIWALNNNSIRNPHQISPGKEIAFLPGTGVSLPSVAIGSSGGAMDANETNESPAEKKKYIQETETGSLTYAAPPAEVPGVIRAGRSAEWQKLPNQPWELLDIKMPEGVDPLGFDTKTRIHFGGGRTGFELPAIVQSERLDYLGQITSSREESTQVSSENIVFLESFGTLQVGETYAIAQDPSLLKADIFSRTGYSYFILGTVKITGVKDQVFIGTITSTRHPITRGAKLIHVPPRVTIPDPIPGPGTMEATLFLDKTFSSFATAQHRQVFVDRGTDDGVQPGMVFRLFEYNDPTTKKQISETGLTGTGDLIVVQVSPRFSSAVVISSTSTLNEFSKVTLLTDVSDVLNRRKSGAKDVFGTERTPGPDELDTLEQLDGGAGLGKGEARELRQLEKWQEDQNKPTQEIPADQLPPPQATGQEEVPPPADEGIEELPPPPTVDESVPEVPTIEQAPPEEIPPAEELPPAPPVEGGDEAVEEDLPPPPPPVFESSPSTGSPSSETDEEAFPAPPSMD